MPKPAATTAYTGSHRIWLAPVACPHCQHLLHANVIELLGGGHVLLICTACHRDVLTIEKVSPTSPDPSPT